MRIYKITNTINGKSYIGKTEKSIQDRLARHIYNANIGIESYLYRAMRYYGPEKFQTEELEVCANIEHLNLQEKYYIIKHGTHCISGTGYNMTFGGEGGDTSLSPKYKAGMSKRDINGSKNPMYGKKGKGNKNFGKKRKDGSGENISRATKLSWEKDKNRKTKQSKKWRGDGNPMYGKTPSNAVKIEFENQKYDSITEAHRKTGASIDFIKKWCKRI